MDSIEVTISHDVIDSVSENSDSSSQQSNVKINMLPFKILCLVLVILVSIGWVGIIALLIIKEEWQLVLVAWLLLYAAVHFCYWYCRRNSTRTLSAQIRQQVIGRIRGAEAAAQCDDDCPPSYDDLVKSEMPPPAYYSVVDESPKLKRFFNVKGVALPWFLKKKALESQQPKSSSGDNITTVVVGHTIEAGSSTNTVVDQSGLESWKSSTTVVSIDGEQTLELPSYETLIRGNLQPVLTPIHQALANLPNMTPPPPYSPRRMETITESQQNE